MASTRVKDPCGSRAIGECQRRGRADAGIPEKTPRVLSLDAVRGAAVGLMIAWHAADGWLANEHRSGLGWSTLTVIGGVGAPFFFLTAGAAVGLGARRGRALSAALTRGAEIVLIGHALALAQWAIDHAALGRLEAAPALALGVLAIGSALLALRRRMSAWPSVGLGAAHLVALSALGGLDARIVLRFDVLHCIGFSCIACALVAHPLMRRASPFPLPSLALATAALASAFASGWLVPEFEHAGALLAWLGSGPKLRDVAPFPVVPWVGYALLGCAAALAPLRRATRPLALAGLVLAALSFEAGFAFTRDLLHDLPHARPLARLVFHGALALSLTCLLQATRSRLGSGLAVVGRASLPIYALHLFVTHGTLARPFRRALDPLACALLGLALILACAALAWLLARTPTPLSTLRATSTNRA